MYNKKEYLANLSKGKDAKPKGLKRESAMTAGCRMDDSHQYVSSKKISQPLLVGKFFYIHRLSHIGGFIMKKSMRIKTVGTILALAVVAFGTTACGNKTANNTSEIVSVEAAATELTTEVLNIDSAFGQKKIDQVKATADTIKSEKEEEIKKQEETEKAAKQATQTTKRVASTDKEETSAPQSVEKPSVSGLSVNGILQLVNYERNVAGLGSLRLDGTLCEMAAVRAPELAEKWSHERPDGTKVTAVAEDFGFSYRKLGENLAKGYNTSEKAVNAWMNSEGHRANIMGSYSRTGIAIENVGGKTYIVQLFAN